MNFHDLSQALRTEIGRRLAAGETTQQQLAAQTGFRQAHISNFLNGRRALSLEGLDRLLRVGKLQARDLMPPDQSGPSLPQLDAAASPPGAFIPLLPPAASLFERRYPETAGPIILPTHVLRLRKPGHAIERRPWQRLVGVRVTPAASRGMQPLLTPGDIAIIDRHDLRVDGDGTTTHGARVFAVEMETGFRFSHLQRHSDGMLVYSSKPSIGLVILPEKKIRIVGRVCHVLGHL